ncbi:elongation factor Ts [Aureimonas fodinaquatilis]|uniref:Elongation factor Ts n=1 Tax=Aureimonas fodinaquatilis TaxID=2565783 RepID=A0A5B0DUK9_9HYPH|nr:translation elongation factor Ts [Aureimonas fodinaquatilis]KAA0970497.1 elongation factor Ts [Aureimonas fodinaquatilis]
MTISAAMVKELREKTGAGMMDCKTALSETGGDMEAAIDWLRAKGIAKADKKAGRTAAEGLVGVASGDNRAIVVEVNSETDFVARNEAFQTLVREIATVGLNTDGNVDAVGGATVPSSGKSVTDTVRDAVATIGENLGLRRSKVLSVENGVVATYIHNQVVDGLGRLGVLVAIESAGDKAALTQFGRQIAMHVAATNPLALNDSDVDSDTVDRERAIFSEQARQSGKPENIIEKMVEGRIRKFYEEVVLLKQGFVMNPDLTVEAALKQAEEGFGAPARITGFVRFALGEGIEREESDFAAEVAAVAGKK